MVTSKEKNETRTRPGASFAPLIAGFTGGVTSTSLLLPLDVIKVRLQVSENGDNVRRADGVKRRMGAMRIFRGIIKHEGIAGLYQGWTPAVIGSAVSWGGYFYLYENFKQQLVTYKLQSSATPFTPEALRTTHLNSADNFILACTSGACMVALTNPIWLIKTRMQLQMRKSSQLHTEVKPPYKNMLDAAVTIVREEGVFALYKGGGAAMLLTSHGGVQFVVYEFLKKHFNYKRASREENMNRSVWERLELSMGYLSLGAVAKIAASTATYPLQVIKARMQQRNESLEITHEGEIRAVKRNYNGLLDTIRRTWQREGIAGYFQGCIPNAIRVVPGAAITFGVYEAVMDWFGH